LHLQPGAQPVWARELRVELEDLVIELPGTSAAIRSCAQPRSA
jgi:hypothetical protein